MSNRVIRLIAAVGALLCLNGCGIPIGVLYGLEGVNAVTGIGKNVLGICVTLDCLARAPAKAVEALTPETPQAKLNDNP